MYEEYDSVRFFDRFFLSVDFGFFSDFFAGYLGRRHDWLIWFGDE